MSLVREAWRRTLPYAWRQAVGRVMHPYAMASARRRALRSVGSQGAGPPAVVGFFQGSSGIALCAQLASRALDTLGVEHRRIDVGDLAAPGAPDSLTASAWLFCLNAPELLLLLRAWGGHRLAGPRYGYWAWELPRAPMDWIRTSAILDGVLAPSQFIADALAGARSPLTVAPHPLAAIDFEAVAVDRSRPAGEVFRTVMAFDFKSSAARKNPEGAIRAFTRAFGDDPGARLIIKTSNADFAPEARRALQAVAAPNVEIVDGRWPRARLLNFIASADALISLHRSEGFGLTLAEAMMLGTPVVATAWSGNLQFMDETSACLVPAAMIPVRDPQAIYNGQVWAAPDEAAAAAHLRRLRYDRGFADALAARARTAARDALCPEAWLAKLPAKLQLAIAPENEYFG